MTAEPAAAEAALEAAKRAPHKYNALRPHGAARDAPAVLLADQTTASLHAALEDAATLWPGCTRWELVGGGRINLQRDDTPSLARNIDRPEVLATLTTA
jgi:hypothetical protein